MESCQLRKQLFAVVSAVDCGFEIKPIEFVVLHSLFVLSTSQDWTKRYTTYPLSSHKTRLYVSAKT